jgi:hypothetical protein
MNSTIVIGLVLIVGNSAFGAPLFVDPQGDTFGAPDVAHDIEFVDSQLSATSLTFTVGLFGNIAPPSAFAADSVVGFIDIDVDQDPLSGEQSNKSRLSPNGDSNLGIEFYLDLFSERFNPGMVEVVDAASMQVIGLAPASFAATSLEVEVPLQWLGGDGIVNYGVIVGDFVDVSDEARNVGQPVAYSVPEPAGVFLFALGLGVVVLRAQTRECGSSL